MTYAIVGAGPAGVAAADTLREVDKSGDIVLVSGEPEPPYSRMAIPYYLEENIAEEGTYLRIDPDHYEDRNIGYVQAQARSVNVDDGVLELEGADDITFSKLLVASGASPIKPPVSGLDLPGVHHCWTLEDIRNIKDLAAEGADVVLVGAGFIGCIILESLVKRGVNLTVVEAEGRMVPRMMSDMGGALIKKWCENKGVRVFTSTRVNAIEEADGGLRVALDNGETVPAKLVVVAAGVKSNTDLLVDSGVELDNGIVVDDHLKSSVDNIYAAGDCARGPDFMGGWDVHAVQPTATEHGRVAALNMAGGDFAYQGSLSMNVLDTAGLISTSFGRWDGVEGGDMVEDADEEKFRYTRLVFDGDRLVGTLTLGRTDFVGVLRGLIQARIHLGPWKDKLMQDPGRVFEAYVGCTRIP